MKARYAGACARTDGCRVTVGDEVTKLPSGRWGHTLDFGCQDVDRSAFNPSSGHFEQGIWSGSCRCDEPVFQGDADCGRCGRIIPDHDQDVRDRAPVLPIAGGSGVLAGATDVRDGLYTVVLDDDSHVTLRFKTQPESAGFAPGEQIVGFLRGSDNESDYTSFAFVKGERLVVWKKFREGHARQQLAASFMLLANDEGKNEAGVRYARESGNCFRCNRTLTDPVSIELGIGPVCRGDA